MSAGMAALRRADDIHLSRVVQAQKAGKTLEEMADVADGPQLVAMLIRDNRKMREAGIELAEAAMRVVRTYDGTHRLSLAVAKWCKAVADQGDRDRHSA